MSKSSLDIDTNSSVSSEPISSDFELSDREYVIKGFNFWLNNKPRESEAFFKLKSDRTTVLAGYAFILCMNGVISYETDKIDEAQQLLKLLEKRCTSFTTTNTTINPHSSSSCSSNNSRQLAVPANSSFNWLTNVRYKIFGNVAGVNVNETCYANVGTKSTAQLLEEQIILGDVYMSMAILTFLTQDISGLMKGGWLLRKAWKIYQKTYTQLYEMFIARFKDNTEPHPPIPLNYAPRQRFSITRSISYFNWRNPSTTQEESAVLEQRKEIEHPCNTQNQLSAPQSPLHETIESNNVMTNDVKIDICQSPKNPSRHNLKLELIKHEGGFDTIKTCPINPSTNTSNFQLLPSESIDSNNLKHLMGAASFGYGLFQLITSLLPTKLLKIISIFGFEGDRNIGVSCLMYARSSSDMRAVLATLTLLWFYTFGTQLFHNEDGYSKEKIDAVNDLLNDCHEHYHSAAIFLFFRGRLERMKADAKSAIDYFQKSYRFSAQSELKLLCLHEIAWCKLIELDFFCAMKYFNEIRQVSVYSKAFYTYLTAICQGSMGNFDNIIMFKDQITTIIRTSGHKQTHVTSFIQNRVIKFNDIHLHSEIYWRYLIYEMLFLWSALSSILPENLLLIVNDCSIEMGENQDEPMVGLQHLLIGGARMARKEYQPAINAYRRCIAKRANITTQDMHISAFAHFELATLLLHCNRNNAEALEEAKKLLQNAQKFSNYDLENRLCVQIQQELKKLN